MRRAKKLLLFLGVQNASAFAPYPAPAGYHWEFVTDRTNGGQRVTDATKGNSPVVALVGN